MLSTHKVEVVSVHPRPHPNADKLEVVDVFGGYPCCVQKGQYAEGQLAAYLPPDSVVDVARPEFAFLAKGAKTRHRVRTIRLRGVQSYGLLMPAPDGYCVGDDAAAFYGVEHYEPELKSPCQGGEAEDAPPQLTCLSKYDVDALRRYQNVFEPGEMVMVTEKIHGANSRFCYLDGRMWCGSRNEWKKEDPTSLWWKVLETTPSIRQFCEEFVGYVLYGEIYGDVQSLRYGCQKGEVKFAAFDVLLPRGGFGSADVTRDILDDCLVPQVPLLAYRPFDFAEIETLADGPSQVPGADHFREGCVIKPLYERFHQSIGRVQLKIVGTEYLEKT